MLWNWPTETACVLTWFTILQKSKTRLEILDKKIAKSKIKFNSSLDDLNRNLLLLLRGIKHQNNVLLMSSERIESDVIIYLKKKIILMIWTEIYCFCWERSNIKMMLEYVFILLIKLTKLKHILAFKLINWCWWATNLMPQCQN